MPRVADAPQTETFVHRFDSLTNADVPVVGAKMRRSGR
jgi:hypothetical protein